MNTADALVRFFADHALAGPDAPRSVEECYRDPWIRAELGSWRVPILPTAPIRDGLVLHDLHHMLTGYATTWTGELELAVWELASGGCHRHVYLWIDRVAFALVGSLLAPRLCVHALKRGWAERNLYALAPERVLEMPLEEARAQLNEVVSPGSTFLRSGRSTARRNRAGPGRG